MVQVHKIGGASLNPENPEEIKDFFGRFSFKEMGLITSKFFIYDRSNIFQYNRESFYGICF